MDVLTLREHIARNLQLSRALRGMSLYELADKTGLDVDLLMKIEHAQTDIDLDTFACICASLDTKPHELVETPGRRFALEYRSTPPDAHTPSKG